MIAPWCLGFGAISAPRSAYVGGVRCQPRRGDRITKDLAGELEHPSRCFQIALALNPLENRYQIGWHNLGHWHPSDRGAQVAQQIFGFGQRVFRPAFLGPLVDELSGDCGKGVVGGDAILNLLPHLLDTGVFAYGYQLAGLVAALARIPETDFGIGAQT